MPEKSLTGTSMTFVTLTLITGSTTTYDHQQVKYRGELFVVIIAKVVYPQRGNMKNPAPGATYDTQLYSIKYILVEQLLLESPSLARNSFISCNGSTK